MSKIKKIFQITKIILKNPKSLAVLLKESKEDYRKYVIDKYGLRSGLLTIDFLDLFPKFSETLNPISFLPQGSTLLDYALLKNLAKKYENCRFLEIGTWRGESIANVASVSKECVSISLSDEQMRTVGFKEEDIKTSKFFSKTISNVKHFEDDSQTFDFTTIGKFDLIFIDGHHSYESVKNDTRNVCQLLKNDSCIVWHDYVDVEGSVRWDILAAILDGVPENYRSKIFHVSNTLAAVYLPNNFKLKNRQLKIINKIFEVKIEGKKIE